MVVAGDSYQYCVAAATPHWQYKCTSAASHCLLNSTRALVAAWLAVRDNWLRGQRLTEVLTASVLLW